MRSAAHWWRPMCVTLSDLSLGRSTSSNSTVTSLARGDPGRLEIFRLERRACGGTHGLDVGSPFGGESPGWLVFGQPCCRLPHGVKVTGDDGGLNLHHRIVVFVHVFDDGFLRAGYRHDTGGSNGAERGCDSGAAVSFLIHEFSVCPGQGYGYTRIYLWLTLGPNGSRRRAQQGGSAR